MAAVTGTGVAVCVSDLDGRAGGWKQARRCHDTLSRSGRRALFCRDPDGNAVNGIEQPVTAAPYPGGICRA